MRHRVKGSNLHRKSSHRLSTLRNLASALIEHKRIKTTLAKAKEAKVFVEPMITRAKDDTVFSRRHIARHIQNNEVLKELFETIGPKVADRPGGYTRIVKLGNRVGDAAEMAVLELVDFSEPSTAKKPAKKEKVTEEQAVSQVADEPVKAEIKDEDVSEANVVEETEKEEESSEEESPEKEEK